MKQFDNRAALEKSVRRNSFSRMAMDRFHIQVLHEYRVAAAFAVSALSLMKTKDKKTQEVITKVLKKCEAVLAKKTIYDITGRRNTKISQQLEAAVEKADDVIAHAGNICNNCVLLFSEEIQPMVMRARDACDSITRRMRY